MALTIVQPRNYLTLVQDLFREVGAAGKAPSTTANQSGEALRLVNYIHDAELDIQNLYTDWRWLRKSLTAWTKASDKTGMYTDNTGTTSAFPADLAEWDYETWKITDSTGTQGDLQTVEYQDIRREILDTTDEDLPWRAIIMPDNTIQWDLTPDQAYEFTCDYFAQPYDLKNDTDVSNIPARFANTLIVEWARLKYGMYENAPEQVAKANLAIYGSVDGNGTQQAGLLARLENDQLWSKKNSRYRQGSRIVISPYGEGDYGHDGEW